MSAPASPLYAPGQAAAGPSRLRRAIRHGLAGLCLAIAMTMAGHDAGATYDGESPPDSGGRSGGGFSFGIDLTCLFTGCGKDKAAADQPGDAATLARSGPGLPDAYAMSGFTLHGLVRGGAPFVVDCEARDATLRIEMKTRDREPFVYNIRLDGRIQEIFRLPASFDAEPRAARISIHAVKNQPGPEVPAALRIHGLGMGEKAVGSVAIDQISFGPPEVRIGRFGKARYGFHARSDFNRVVAEFARVENRNGIIQVTERVDKEDIGELTRDSWVGRDKPRIWDGKDENGEVSEGLHLLQVRAWRSAVREGDWVVSWSPDWVEIKW